MLNKDEIGFGRGPVKDMRPAFIGELDAFARSGITDNFVRQSAIFKAEQKVSPELGAMIHFGTLYHIMGLEYALSDFGDNPGFKTDIYLPTINSGENGAQTVTVPQGSKKVKGRLLGVIGAKLVENSKENFSDFVVLHGVVILDGDTRAAKNARVVGYNTATGQFYFHPKSLPADLAESPVEEIIRRFVVDTDSQ